jgi:hypothetical protein
VSFHLELFHKGIIVVRIMMKNGETPDVGRLAQTHGLVPRGMPPANLAGEFLFRIGAVVDDQIGTVDKLKNILVGFAGDMLRIGDITSRLALVLDPITCRAIRMVQRLGHNPHVIE